MPIPSPGNLDVASQTTLAAVKAKTDIIGASVALEGGGNIAAIKAKTDPIPAAPASQAKIDTSLYTSRLTPVHSDAALVQNTLLYIDIQPPAGETWVIYVTAAFSGVGGVSSQITLANYDGATLTGAIVGSGVAEGNPDGVPPNMACSGWFRITNTNYLRLTYWHNAAAAKQRKYTYWGWKE